MYQLLPMFKDSRAWDMLSDIAAGRILFGVEKNVELLTDVKCRIAPGYTVNHFQHASIDPLGVVAGKRLLGRYHGFYADELQRNLLVGTPAWIARCTHAGPNARNVRLV